MKERKKYTKIEAPFTSKLKVWMKYNIKFTYGWEVKYPKKDRYTFSGDKSFKKELDNLLGWGGTYIYKYSDRSGLGTPHDGFTIWHEPAFFFFTWNGEEFYVIEVSSLNAFYIDHTSMTESDAVGICSYKSKLGEILK